MASSLADENQDLPKLEHQVGGHSSDKQSLKVWDGVVLKPFQSKNRGLRERDFYAEVNAIKMDTESSQAKLCEQLCQFIPDYFGVTTVRDCQYLKLENLVAHMTNPSIMDVKMGTKTYEPDATPDKVEYEKQKFVFQEEIGFRVQAIKSYDRCQKKYITYDKYFGRSLQLGDISNALGKFFYDGYKIQKHIISLFVEKIKKIVDWFEKQDMYVFIASSLLFILDNNESDDHCTTIDLRLIDFAHVRRQENSCIDDGLLTGLRSILHFLDELEKKCD